MNKMLKLFLCWFIRMLLGASLGFLYVAFFGTKGGGDPLYDTSDFGPWENIGVISAGLLIFILLFQNEKRCSNNEVKK
jgi:hypothetical protein